MKKILLAVVVAAALLIWIASWFRSPEAVATSTAKAWPGDLGNLDAVAARFEPLHANEASAKLTALVSSWPKNEALDEFVRNEIARDEPAIGAPPALPDVIALRELLEREPIVWERHPGIDHKDTEAMRTVQLTAARALVAGALAKARANDPAAWQDLYAAWKLERALDPHPQLMAQTAALTTSRMINGAAWKMPLPVPAWFAEVQTRDHVRPLLRAFQFSAASYADSGVQMFPTKMLATQVEHDRRLAEQLFATTACDVTTPANELGVDLSTVWRRAFRYRAEREATANALRAREGKPIVPSSGCSDGGWSFDGATLRFTREIPTAAPDRPMPLVLRVRAQEPAPR